MSSAPISDNTSRTSLMQPAQHRIQGCEQLVGFIDSGPGQPVEEGRFSGVGVTNQ